jgi:hypothetical protein
MPTKGLKVAYVSGGWMLATLALLILSNSLTVENFFIMSFTGLLIIVELSGPFIVKPVWRSRMDVLIAVGVLVFTLFFLAKVMAIVHINLPI